MWSNYVYADSVGCWGNHCILLPVKEGVNSVVQGSQGGQYLTVARSTSQRNVFIVLVRSRWKKPVLPLIWRYMLEIQHHPQILNILNIHTLRAYCPSYTGRYSPCNIFQLFPRSYQHHFHLIRIEFQLVYSHMGLNFYQHWVRHVICWWGQMKQTYRAECHQHTENIYCISASH